MKKVFYLLFVLVCKLSFAASAAEKECLFQIGFEFQECHHMCPWAITAPEIQSKPIFSVCQGERVLWDLTIDWQDLEFVTKPVTNNELEILKITMESIQMACDTLVELNERAQTFQDVTFSKWIKAFTKNLKENKDENISCLVITTHFIQSHSFGSFKFPKPYGDRFAFRFQPQVTIQHHLIDSINLCLGLLANDVIYQGDDVSFDMKNGGIPYLKDFIMYTSFFKKEVSTTNVSFCRKSTPQEGFLFLHMLTCIDLSHKRPLPLGSCGDLDITKSSFHTQTMCLLHSGSGQVNAKLSVNFLSRRPFSSMWKDIASGEDYEDFLIGKINPELLDSLKTKFDQMNYGEIFFTEEGERMDLTQLTLTKSGALQDSCIQFLLKNGIMSLEFIRRLRVSFLQNYFELMLKSIASPSGARRCVFDKEKKSLVTVEVEYDLLSPPHLISETDSMGAFKDDSKHPAEYGEAIIEIRMITDVPESVLKRICTAADCTYDPKIKGKFLGQDFSEIVSSDFTLQRQVIELFSYLEKLIKGEVCDE